MIQVERLMRALADNTRLRVLNLLLGEGELCVCELTAAMEMAQPRVSRHLAILREAGLVLDRREGLWIHYRIHPELPLWAGRLLDALHDGCGNREPYAGDRERLTRESNRKRESSDA